MAMTTGLVGIANLFIYCYLGKLSTESYAKMADCVYNIIGLQKHYILMIANMQKPLYYHGFGVIYLELETFTRVSLRFQRRPQFFYLNHSEFLRNSHQIDVLFIVSKVGNQLLHGDYNSNIQMSI